MNKYIKKDRKLRLDYLKNELYYRVIKVLLSNQLISLESRTEIYTWFLLKVKSYYKTKVKNFCIVSGYSRSIQRRFRLSRIQIKQFTMDGVLPGIKKSS